MHNMFSPESGKGNSSFQLIPNGTLSSAVLTVKEIKRSKERNGEYARIELTLDGGEHTGRKIWTVIMNPLDENNSEGGRKMGITTLTRLFEASGLFTIGDRASYDKYNGADFNEMLSLLDGKRVAIKIKIAKGKDGHDDKNDVADFLTPNPESNGYPGWKQLHGGAVEAYNGSKPAAQAFTQPKVTNPQGPSKPASNAPSWLQKPGQQSNNPF